MKYYVNLRKITDYYVELTADNEDEAEYMALQIADLHPEHLEEGDADWMFLEAEEQY